MEFEVMLWVSSTGRYVFLLHMFWPDKSREDWCHGDKRWDELSLAFIQKCYKKQPSRANKINKGSCYPKKRFEEGLNPLQALQIQKYKYAITYFYLLPCKLCLEQERLKTPSPRLKFLRHRCPLLVSVITPCSSSPSHCGFLQTRPWWTELRVIT